MCFLILVLSCSEKGCTVLNESSLFTSFIQDVLRLHRSRIVWQHGEIGTVFTNTNGFDA